MSLLDIGIDIQDANATILQQVLRCFEAWPQAAWVSQRQHRLDLSMEKLHYMHSTHEEPATIAISTRPLYVDRGVDAATGLNGQYGTQHHRIADTYADT